MDTGQVPWTGLRQSKIVPLTGIEVEIMRYVAKAEGLASEMGKKNKEEKEIAVSSNYILGEEKWEQVGLSCAKLSKDWFTCVIYLFMFIC